MSSGDNEGINIENSNAVENFIQGEIFADIFPNMPALKPKKSLKKEHEELLSRLPEFRVIRSSRRKRTLHAYRQNGVIEIHIPDRLSRRQEFEVIPEMIGHALGEFAPTRRSVTHTGPGVGATRSSKHVALK